MIVNFKICLINSCKEFEFLETTGRRPGVDSGYGEFEDISGYTGTITFTACDGTTFSYTHKPSVSNVPYRISWDYEGNAHPGDGVYMVEYEVKDANGVVQGRATSYLLVDCEFICDYHTALAKMAQENCDPCESQLLEKTHEVALLHMATKNLLNESRYSMACTTWGRVVRRSKRINCL